MIMNTPEIDPELRTKVTRLKEVDLRYRIRANQSLAICLIPGVVVGVGIWFIQKPIDRDANMFWGVFALGFAIWFCGCMFTRMLFPKPDVKCPQCENDWTSSDEYPINLLTWRCCPGCGLQMNDDDGRHEKL